MDGRCMLSTSALKVLIMVAGHVSIFISAVYVVLVLS